MKRARNVGKVNKVNKVNNDSIVKILFSFFVLMIVLYLVSYFIWVYPLHDLSKYQNKEWIKNISENLILGIKDPEKIYKVRRYQKTILSFWYCYWFFHTKQYTIWVHFNVKNKFSDQGVVRIWYYDFFKKELKHSTLQIDFTETKTFLKNDTIVIQHHKNYIQEIDMNRDTMKIRIDTNELNIDLSLSIDDYSTQFPALIPRYDMMKHIFDVGETGCPEEWGFDIPMIGKIMNGSFNHTPVESGGNYWFDHFIGYNNFYFNEYVWFVLLNDDWLIYILLFDTEKNIKLKGGDVLRGFIVKDIKNNKTLTCGMDTNTSALYNTMDKLIHPKKLDINYVSKDDFDIYYEMPNFTMKMTSKPNEASQKSTMNIDYYPTDDIDIKNLNDWDTRYYKTLTNLNYVELVTMTDIKIVYNNETIHFIDRVVVDGVENFNGFENSGKDSHIYCDK